MGVTAEDPVTVVPDGAHVRPTAAHVRRVGSETGGPRARPSARLVAVLCLLLPLGCIDAPVSPTPLTEAEEEAVRAVERAYVEGWEANDPEAVMATLARGTVLVPDGMAPIRGDSAIRAFWWPDDGSETRVTAYRTSVEEVGGSGSVAYLRGSGDLAFDWREAPDGAWRSFTSRSAWLAVLRRGEDGAWRMTHRMWHALDER